MNDRIKKALDQVRAGEELKDRTRAFLYRETDGYRRKRTAYYRRFLPAAVCFLLVLLCGRWLYFTPTAEISIDVNPSLELGVNRFDKVISVCARSSDGEELAKSLDVKYLDYTEALSRILENENVAELLSRDEIMTIGVIGQNDAQCARMMEQIESGTSGEKNTYCYYADTEDVSEAHELGLSYGKYRAYQMLLEYAPEITAEEVQGMTMREIRDLLGELSGEEKRGTAQGTGNGRGAENGQGTGTGKAQNRGQGNGQGRKRGRGFGGRNGA